MATTQKDTESVFQTNNDGSKLRLIHVPKLQGEGPAFEQNSRNRSNYDNSKNMMYSEQNILKST